MENLAMENLNMQSNMTMMENSEFEEKVYIDDLILPSKLINLAEIDDIKQEPIEEEKKPAIFESDHNVAVGKKIQMEENILKLYEELDKEKSENSTMDFSLRRSLKIRQFVEKAFEDKPNEGVCFLCKECEIAIGHQTSSCLKKYCKKCHQRGHYGMNCKIFGKDFVTKDEHLVKKEKNDLTKTEISYDALPCKVESKQENFIAVKKELIKSENQNCDEFSKSEEEALIYCLESMSPKKRKIDPELRVDIPLEEVQQKIIERLSNDVATLTESKRKMEIKLNDLMEGKETLKVGSEIFNEVQKQIIAKLNKELEILRESKETMELEFNIEISEKRKFQNQLLELTDKQSKETLKVGSEFFNEVQKQIIAKLNKDLEILRESKEKMELELNIEISEKRKYQNQLLELSDKAQRIEYELQKEKKRFELLSEIAEKLRGKETELRKYQNEAEKDTSLCLGTEMVQLLNKEKIKKRLLRKEKLATFFSSMQ